MIGIHFTNYAYSWGVGKPFFPTGIARSFVECGLRKHSNVVVPCACERVGNYIHHGMRTNNARGFGFFNIPCAVLIDISGLKIQKGYDGPGHFQVNDHISNGRIIDIIPIDVNCMMSDYISTGEGKPSDICRLGNKGYTPFRLEFQRMDSLDYIDSMIFKQN